MIEKRIHILLDKLAKGTLSKEELRFLELQAVENDFVFDALEGYGQKMHSDTDLDLLQSRLQQRLKEKKENRPVAWWKYAVAAVSIGIMLFSGWWMINGEQSNKIAMKERVENQEMNQVIEDSPTEEAFEKEKLTNDKKETFEKTTETRKEKESKVVENEILDEEVSEEVQIEEEQVIVDQDIVASRTDITIEDDADAEAGGMGIQEKKEESMTVQSNEQTSQKSSRQSSASAPPQRNKVEDDADQKAMSVEDVNETEYVVDGIRVESSRIDTVLVEYSSKEETRDEESIMTSWSRIVKILGIEKEQLVQVKFDSTGNIVNIYCQTCQSNAEDNIKRWFSDNNKLLSVFKNQTILFILSGRNE